MLRTPSAIEGEGGAITEDQARAKNRMLQVRDQMAQLAAENGLKVSPGITAGLLPTPRATESGEKPETFVKRTSNLQIKGNRNGGQTGMPLGVAIQTLLPTPNTMDMLPRRSDEALARSRAKGGASNLKDAEIVRNPLLPTVTVQDGKNTGGSSQFERNTKPLNTQVLVGLEWGKFAPAIAKWQEVLGQSAPAPTKPDGKDGAHRLSSEFTEWMMGLPQGWITDCGLTRNEELKACGNGVVPQQARLALSILLEGMTLEKERESCDVSNTNGQ